MHNIVNKTEVLCVTLSDNQKNPDLKNVKDEHLRSMKILGVPEDRIVLHMASQVCINDTGPDAIRPVTLAGMPAGRRVEKS